MCGPDFVCIGRGKAAARAQWSSWSSKPVSLVSYLNSMSFVGLKQKVERTVSDIPWLYTKPALKTFGWMQVSNGLLPAFFTTDTVGSMARTAEDLILLDSIVRLPNCSTDAKGAIPEAVSCDAYIERDLNVSSLRLGLPSTFGWGTTGVSQEVRKVQLILTRPNKYHSIVYRSTDKSWISPCVDSMLWPCVERTNLLASRGLIQDIEDLPGLLVRTLSICWALTALQPWTDAKS